MPFLADAQATLPSANSWDWHEVVRVVIKDGGLQLMFGPSAILLGVMALAVWLLWHLKFSGKAFRHYEVVEAELNIANIGKVKLQPNDEIVRVAYQAWVELSTRKVGIPFDENHDVITEVYSSWYEAFGRLRELAKTIPCRNIQKSSDTRYLVELMVRVLNDGLRPHLTKWQARFRRWYEKEADNDENVHLSPQEIQRRFPDYKAVVADLVSIQSQIVQYRNFLWAIAHCEKGIKQDSTE